MCESASLYGNFPEFMWTDKGLPFLKTHKCNLFWLRLHYSTLELHLVWPRKAFSSERLSVQTWRGQPSTAQCVVCWGLSPHKGLLKTPNKNSGAFCRRSSDPLKMFRVLQTIKRLCRVKKKSMIYTEIHANEYSFIFQMSAAAGSRKFHTDMEKQEDRIKGVKRAKENRTMNLNKHWQVFVYQTFFTLSRWIDE